MGGGGNDNFPNPTREKLLEVVADIKASPAKAATIEMTLQVNNITITPDTGITDEDISDGTYVKYGYKVELAKDNPVKETYKFYVHSDLAFERANDLPLVTYGLHIPNPNLHPAMDVNAYYIGANELQKNVYSVSSPEIDIKAAGTHVNMDYTYTHPVQGLLPTLRESISHYLGRAFVNNNVELLHTDGMPSEVRGETDKAVNLTKGYIAQVDKWTNLPADDDPSIMGKEYPKVGGVDGVPANEGAKYVENQPANLKIYDKSNLHDPIFNSNTGLALPEKNYTSPLPGIKTMVYVAEDLPTDTAHPYHNGPNRSTVEVEYIFDSPVDLRFSPNVGKTRDTYSLTLLSTATDAELEALLGANGAVIYGEKPNSTVNLEAQVTIVRGADDALPESVTVTTTDKNGRSVTETVKLVAQTPPVIKIEVLDENGKPIPNVTIPDITDAVIGRSYTVFAPIVAGYVLAGGQQNSAAINPVQQGTNIVTFRYVPAEKTVEYAIVYTYEGAPVQRNTQVGIAGKAVSHTAAADFVNGAYKYTLKTAEPKSKTITLFEDPTQNVLSFAYDRAAVDNGGGGGGGGTVNYYSVLYTAAPYGTLDGTASLQVKSGGKPDSTPKVIPQEGYTFLGWHTGDKSKLVDPLTVKITQATVFYAAFKTPDGETVGPEDSASRPIPELELNDHLVYLLGDELGNFRPDAGITRAEVVVLFSRLLKKPMPKDVALTSKFADVSADKWYASTVAYMEQFGIITGYEDGTFRPEAPIARSEFVTIASRFSQLELTDQQLFPDVPSDNWAAVHINSAKLKGWITGYEDGTFRPTQTIARAEAVKIVNALLGRKPDTAYIDAHAAELAVFPDLAASHWAYYEIMEAANSHDHSGKPERWTKVK